MSLTSAQAAALKTAIQGDANLTAHVTNGNHGAITDYYNAAGTGTVWRPSISVAELNTAIVWSAFIALTLQQQNAYFALIQGDKVDATNPNVRTGFNSIFGAGATLTNLTALAQKVPTRFEQLFTTAQVCSCFGQSVTVADVAQALGS